VNLAGALQLRADAQKRLAQLRQRILLSARHQEGDQPPEDPQALLEEIDRVATELEDLIRRINRTNATSVLSDGVTITDAIAERDVPRLRHALVSAVADSASGHQQPVRQIRTELKFVSAVSVPDLRDRANDLARRYRELDTQIQEANWRFDLVEE